MYDMNVDVKPPREWRELITGTQANEKGGEIWSKIISMCLLYFYENIYEIRCYV